MIAIYEQSDHVASADLMGYYLRFRENAIPIIKFSLRASCTKLESVLAGIYIKTPHRNAKK
jgi:hypothetical protein